MSKILVVCHDAGGAEVISSWVKQQKNTEFSFLLDGPAILIFQKKMNLKLSELAEVQDLTIFDMVLTGTSWGSALEREFLERARLQQVKSVTFLDHWWNYKDRFKTLPSEIWVGDNQALEIAKKDFPDIPVVLQTNYYMREIVEAVKSPSEPHDKLHILYVCDPVSTASQARYGDADGLGYNEFTALNGFIKYLASQKEKVKEVRLRLHPAEPLGKYISVADDYSKQFQIFETKGRPLEEDLAWADWVVGCDSMPLAIAAIAGKPVYSCIPQGGPKITLPFKQIKQLFNG